MGPRRVDRAAGRLGHRQGLGWRRVAEPELSPSSSCRRPERRPPEGASVVSCGRAVTTNAERPALARESRAVRRDLDGSPGSRPSRGPPSRGNRRAGLNVEWPRVRSSPAKSDTADQRGCTRTPSPGHPSAARDLPSGSGSVLHVPHARSLAALGTTTKRESAFIRANPRRPLIERRAISRSPRRGPSSRGRAARCTPGSTGSARRSRRRSRRSASRRSPDAPPPGAPPR